MVASATVCLGGASFVFVVGWMSVSEAIAGVGAFALLVITGALLVIIVILKFWLRSRPELQVAAKCRISGNN